MDRPLLDDRAHWLAATNLQAAVVPARFAGLVHAIAAACPEELSRNDPVPEIAAERQAAVLILSADDCEGGPDVLLQQRAAGLRDHTGQVAFPGGARENGDTGPPATAIREAEETGLDPAGVQPLILHIPPSGFDVTGVLAYWRTPSPIRALHPGETTRVMRVPFTAFADLGNRIMLSTSVGWHGPAFVLDGAVVSGYTDEVLEALLRLGGWERPGTPPARSMSTRHCFAQDDCSASRARESWLPGGSMALSAQDRTRRRHPGAGGTACECRVRPGRVLARDPRATRHPKPAPRAS